jgi:hypothetical protein
MGSLMQKMETTPNTAKVYVDRKVWFSMWFLGAIVTFGVAFFAMFYRLVDGRNRHLAHEAELEEKVAAYYRQKGKEPPVKSQRPKPMNAKIWAASIILIIPAFIIMYRLSKDLASHERREDAFLASALPERVFMPQTIPQTTYLLITIVTVGFGGIYWLYKIVNLYNAHYKADLVAEKEISKLMEEEKVVEHM